MKHLSILLCSLILFSACSAQERASEEPIRWLSFEEAVALNEKAPKKMIIDVYTGWCGWCKKMDKTTFMDPDVATAINGSFYAVKLDAERKDTVTFRNQEFVYKPEYKSHELAIALMNAKMSYPTYVFLDEGFAMISPVPGYKTRDEMLQLLGYISSDAYKTKTWEQFAASGDAGK